MVPDSRFRTAECFREEGERKTVEINNIFDSHAHYDDERYDEDRDALFRQLRHHGVIGILNVGCSLTAAEKAVSLARRYPFVYAGVGLHPEESRTAAPGYLERLKQLAGYEKVVAVGEIGLDYHYDDTDKPSQKRIFEEQLLLAEELKLPVIIHSRDAVEDTIDILNRTRCRGVVHCFSGSAETAQIYLNMGYHIGFTGLVTFPNVKKVLEAIKIIPLDRILLETDCPYMAPVPYRGKRCTSDMIAFTAAKIAEIKEMPVQKLIDTATENCKRLFGI